MKNPNSKQQQMDEEARLAAQRAAEFLGQAPLKGQKSEARREAPRGNEPPGCLSFGFRRPRPKPFGCAGTNCGTYGCGCLIIVMFVIFILSMISNEPRSSRYDSTSYAAPAAVPVLTPTLAATLPPPVPDAATSEAVGATCSTGAHVRIMAAWRSGVGD